MDNNKLITIEDSKIINISANSATVKYNGSYNSSVSYSIPNIYVKTGDVLYCVLSVLHSEIPVSYYTVNNTNNILVINSTIYTLILGNYTVKSFMTMVLGVLGTSNYSMTFNDITRVFTLTNLLSVNFTIGSGSTCYILFGFNQNVAITSTLYILTMPNVCDLSGVKRLSIKSNTLQSKNIDSTGKGITNTLATITVNSLAGGISTFLNQTNFGTILTNTHIDIFDIMITDEYNNLINFNGADWFITLQLDIFREIVINPEDFHKIVSS